MQFDERGLDALLSSFPEDLPSQDLCLWLRSVIVPFVRRVVPRGQVQWALTILCQGRKQIMMTYVLISLYFQYFVDKAFE